MTLDSGKSKMIRMFDPLANLDSAALGETPYIGQKVPTLFTALSTGKAATNPIVYGETVNPHVLDKGDIVQITVNNLDEGKPSVPSPWPQFPSLSRSTSQPWQGDASKFPKSPMRRDTVKVPGSGSIVLRFAADNPGVFLFHCHLD